MKIWAAGLLLAFLVPVVAVSGVYAAKPMTGAGTVALVSSTIVDHDVLSDQTTINLVKDTFSLTGTLSGTAVATERDVVHNVTGRDIIMVTFHGVANFTQTGGEGSTVVGTLQIRYEGINNSTMIRGHFVASDGTGKFVGFHGEGSFEGSTTAPLSYTIRWTIVPQS